MPKPKNTPLGLFLKNARIESGHHQKTISDKLGYSTSQFISNWERGISAPPMKIVKTLANNYKCDPLKLRDLIVEDNVNDTVTKLHKQFEKSK